MRISDWSSDVCSSDLLVIVGAARGQRVGNLAESGLDAFLILRHIDVLFDLGDVEIGLIGAGIEDRHADLRPEAPAARSALEQAGQADRKSTRLNSSH